MFPVHAGPLFVVAPENMQTLREAEIAKHMPYAKKVAMASPLSEMIGIEDAISESYYALILAYDSYDPTCGTKFKTWMTYRIKWRLSAYVLSQKTFLKKGENGQRRYAPTTISIEDIESYEIEDRHALSAFDRKEMAVCFENLENILSYKQMDSFKRYYWGNCTVSELAKIDGVTQSAISARIAAARKKIRQHIWGTKDPA